MVRLSYTAGGEFAAESSAGVKVHAALYRKYRRIQALVSANRAFGLQIAEEFNIPPPLFQRRKPAAWKEKNHHHDQPDNIK
jgi:hypothetical protein